MDLAIQGPISGADDAAAGRSPSSQISPWRILLLLGSAVLLGMCLWFTATAVAAELQAHWQLTAAQTGWLTTVVQLGFVAGTAIAAFLNLADVVPARRYFAVSALLAAGANAALLVVDSYIPALVCRFFTGFFLAGVYPPAMKMVATWFAPAGGNRPTRRGLAIGVVVGGVTVGKALPYLLRAFESLTYQSVLVGTSLAAVLAAVLVAATYRDGPHGFPRRPFEWGLVGTVIRHRETRLAIAGYLGHMWELYACWALLASFFYEFFQGRGATAMQAGTRSGLVAFGAIAMGGLGSVMAGQWADKLGRARITIWSMAVSGACALVIGWLTFLSPWVLVCLALVWGFAVVADSAQFSTIVTEVAPAHAVGTALTLQTSLGFLLTAFSIWLTIEVAGAIGWGPAFSMLAVGPALGIWAMGRLTSARAD